ncbi:MAG: Spy/CpxP family protein refolding chaperone [Pyrinomonadaceae bacterium]
MSLKRKIISGVISAFAVVTFTTFVSAQNTDKSQDSTQKQEKRERRGGFGKGDGMGKGMRGGRGGMMRGFRELNLTDAQKEQIHTIMEANKPDKSQFESLRPLMEAKRNGTITAEQEKQLEAFRAERKQKGEQVKAQIMAVLTAEQKAQLEKQKEEWKQKRQERKEMRQERKNKQDKQTDDNDN